MTASPPDKAGLHSLLKLACLVVILAGIHAAADIIVQLLLALFFAIVLNPLVTWFLRRGISRPVAITIVVMVMLVVLTALFGVLAASLSEFSTMLPQYNKELTRKLVDLQRMLPFVNLHISPERSPSSRKSIRSRRVVRSLPSLLAAFIRLPCSATAVNASSWAKE